MRSKSNKKQITSSKNKEKAGYWHPGKNVSFSHIIRLIVLGGCLSAFASSTYANPNDDILSDNRAYASLSQLAYDKELQVGDTVFIDDQTATVTKVEQDGVGFGAIAVEFSDRTVIAFRGTDSKSDVLDDIGLVFNNNTALGNYFGRSISRQYNSALKFVNEFNSEFPNEAIEFTGHSLGGSIAQYAGVVYDHRTVTYNAAPVSELSFSFYNLSDSEIRTRASDVLNIRQDGDPISFLSGDDFLSLGRNVTVDTGFCVAPIELGCLHSIDKLALQSNLLYYSDPEFLDEMKTAFDEFSAQVESLREDREREWQEQYGYNEDQKIIWVEGLDPDEDPIIIYDPTDPVDPIDPTEPVDPVIATNLSGSLSGVVSSTWGRRGSFQNQVIVDTGTESISNVDTLNLSTVYQNNPSGPEGPETGFTHANTISISELTLPVTYQHLTWGEWSSDNYSDNLYSGSGYLRSGNWVIGHKSTSDELAFREGTATFSGDLVGRTFSNGYCCNALSGDASGQIDINVDFTTADVSGRFVFWNNDSPNALSRVQSFDSEILSLGDGVGFQDGWTHWQIRGYFFGEEASEVGGAVRLGVNWVPDDYNTTETAFDGVFVASDDGSGSTIPLFVSSRVYPSSVSDSNWSTSVRPYNVNGVDHTDNAFKNDYNYVSWGGWNTDGTSLETVNDAAWNTHGFWSSSIATETNDVPRLGTATYSGDVLGISNTSELVSGDVTINADFAQDTVSSTMNLEMNGSDLGSFSGTGGINRNIQSSDTAGQNISNGFDASLSGDNGFGLLQGKFAGPNAEEVLGSWGVDFSSGPIDSANGIFRAQN